MADRFEKAMADIAIKAAGNGGPTISDVLRALAASNEDQDEWRGHISEQLEQHVIQERVSQHAMTDMLATLEGKSIEVAQHIEVSLAAHTDEKVHMTRDEFDLFMDGNKAEAATRTAKALGDEKRRSTDVKLWYTSRVARIIGYTLLVGSTMMFIELIADSWIR